MGIARRAATGIGWVWRRIADLSTLAWLWPGSATVAAVGLAVMEDLPFALWLVFGIAAFCFALIAVILWTEAKGGPSQASPQLGMPTPPQGGGVYLGGKNARWIGGTIEDNYGPGVVDAGEGNAFMGATVRGNNRPRRWGARDDISGALRGISGPRPVPTRDTALKDALAYACAGAWNVPLEERYTDQSEVDAFNYRLREMQKDFASDRLTVWGRERMMDAFSSEGWVLIEPEFWKLNKISWTSLFSGGLTRTESRSGLGSDDQYEDLMVSRAQIEERWPSD